MKRPARASRGALASAWMRMSTRPSNDLAGRGHHGVDRVVVADVAGHRDRRIDRLDQRRDPARRLRPPIHDPHPRSFRVELFGHRPGDRMARGDAEHERVPAVERSHSRQRSGRDVPGRAPARLSGRGACWVTMSRWMCFGLADRSGCFDFGAGGASPISPRPPACPSRRSRASRAGTLNGCRLPM